VSDLVRWTPPRIPEGHEWWTDHPHRLAARLAADKRRGLIVEVSRWELDRRVHGALVRRLKPRPPAWRKPAAVAVSLTLIAASVLAALVLLAREVWQARETLLAAAAVAVFLLLVLRAASGHRPTCAGIHCSGCRG
jgi:hypothetical protein